jgi:hypothetical protein
MTNRTKGKIIKTAAVSIDVLVPLAATLTYFPIWVEKSSEATMSGLFLIFAFLSCLPFIKQIKEYFRSPSIWVPWVVLLVLLVCLRNIINEMIVVCFFGTLANVVGAGIYKIGKNIEDRP